MKKAYLVLALLVYVLVSARDVAAQVIDITPEQLYDAYKANEIRADYLYKGKTLRITGAIVDFNVGVFGSEYITLDTGHYGWSTGGINCYLASSETEKAANLSKGQSVTITGIGDGQGLGSLYLRNCVIATSNPQSSAPQAAPRPAPSSSAPQPIPRPTARTPAPSSQNNFQATHRVITNDGTNLRLRNSPGFNGQQIGSLDYGSYVRVLETGAQAVDGEGYSGNWVRVSTPDGRTGWCFGAYLQAVR